MSTLPKQYRELKAVFPDILRELQEIVNGYKQNETSAWLKRAMKYNLQHTDLNGALVTVLTYENLVKSKNVNPEDLRLAHILGWCTEILVAAIVIYDDIMDKGSLRYGLPCWYTLDNIGISGINDALMFEHAVYVLLRNNFRHLDCYTPLMELLHEASFITVCGKNLDISGTKNPVIAFNRETYNTMAVNKGYYIFYLPFALAMYLAGFKDVERFLGIFREFGLFYQTNNDFFDCFGTLEATGKIGTDIQDSKYSWLAVTCMERANDDQKQIMIDCYGSRDPEKVLLVKELYKSLDLPGVYAAYEEESYNRTKALIKESSYEVPPEIFLAILNKLYCRDS